MVNWGEVVHITERAYGTEKADEIESIMEELAIDWVDADHKLTRAAARFKVDGGLAYTDCFASGLALEQDGEVVTDDPDFEVVADRVTGRRLARK